MVKVMRYKLSYASKESVSLYDAEPGVYFNRDRSVDCFNMMCDELGRVTDKYFEVKLEEVDEWGYPVKLLRSYSCD